MKYDVIVIGGGTAGLVTASGCARLGRQVALVEREALGGDCLWTGCVPTKALVATAKLAHSMRNAGRFGLSATDVPVDPKQVMDSMREQRKSISRQDDPAKFRALGIDVIEGLARFVDRKHIEVGGRTIEGSKVVIATGSRTSVPPVPGLAEAGYIDHATFLDRDVFPRRIVILGGGAIGVEFAQILRRFGVEVTIVEMLPTLVAREDESTIAFVTSLLDSEGIAIRTGCRVTRVERRGDERVVTVERESEKPHEIVCDEIFVASGRRGNTEDLALDRAGVRVEKSYIAVDRYLQTTAPSVWACGDVHGGLLFTHVAAYEAVKLVRNMLFPGKSAVDYSNVPWALYTDPEVARVGMTEAEAVKKFGRGKIRVYSVEMEDVDRAVVDRACSGFLKLITKLNGEIVGAHVASTHASTLIQEVVVARAAGMKLGALARVVSPYPSLADAFGKVGALYYQQLGSGRLGAIARRIAKLS